MSSFGLTPEAEQDLFDLWTHIAKDSIEAADRVQAELYNACSFLASQPYAGHVRRDLTSRPVLFWTLPRYSRYLVVYDPELQPITIVRILHGSRDLARELSGGTTI